MDDAVMEAGKRACKDTARIIVSVVVMLMLIWIFHTGHELVTQTKTETQIHGSEDSYIALVFGVATVVFGMLYFIIGLSIIAELALDLLTWLQPEDLRTANDQEKEENTICQVCIQASATVLSMLMLTWAIYHGCKLAAETPKGGLHNCLVFVIGFITMAFGFIYFIIGITIVAESALHLSRRLQQVVVETDNREEGNKDALLAV